MKTKRFMAWCLAIALIVSILPLQVNAAAGVTVDVKPTFSEAEEIALIKKIFSDDISGVEIKNMHLSYCGNRNYQIGAFYGASGEGNANILEFDSGVALSTGDLYKGVTHNPNVGNVSKAFNKKDVINGETVYDTASIEFDIITDKPDTITMKYAFGSEEYMEYAMGKYNDRFAVYVNGENCAVVPGGNQQIAINSVNHVINSEFFRPNSNFGHGADKIHSLGLNIPLDGLTKTFVATKKLHAGSNHIKIVIGDYGDPSYDSVLFIKANSFKLEEYDPGTLSIEKSAQGVTVKRIDKNGQPVTSGTGGFTLVAQDLDGTASEVAYTIADGASQIEIPFGNEGEDLPNTVPFGTKTALITEPKMGAKIDPTKNAVELAIPAPIITKKGDSQDAVFVKGIANAVVELYKNSVLVSTETLDGNGEYSFTNQAVGSYYAKQQHNGLTSAKSNVIKVVKPPVISGNANAFVKETRLMDTADNSAYDLAPFNVVAHKANGAPIAEGPNFKVDNLVDKKVPGLYTVKWTAKDSGFTAVKTKIVIVKPPVPQLFEKNYKDSFIEIKGLPNAVATVYQGETLFELVQLDENGFGKLIDPPDGNYHVSQAINGVASDKVGDVDIIRTFSKPVVTAKADANYATQLDPKSGLWGYNTTYGAFYLEAGATANDVEDDQNADNMNGALNSKLNKAIAIENPMFNSDGEQIDVTNPALDENGDPKPENSTKFYPFVGKYVIKYIVTDSDNMVGETLKLFRVHPPTPSVRVPQDNINSEIEIDALASASVFLYNAAGQPVKIVDNTAQVIADKERYDENKHERLKMEAHADKGKVLTDYLAGLPNGSYRVLQRMYGLNSNLSAVVKVERSDEYPLIKLNGLVTETIVQGKPFKDPGYEVSDLEDDSDLTDDRETQVTVTGDVDSNEIGRHRITYQATDSNKNQSKVHRYVIVKPQAPTITIGDYVDDDFSDNKKGNDIKIVGEPGAIVQILKGKNKQGALQRVVTLDKKGEAFVKNLEVDLDGMTHGAFQTINEIQSAKQRFTISKTNTVPVLTLAKDSLIAQVEKGKSITVGLDCATAQDAEDGNISQKIKIYQQLDANDKVIGEGASELTFDATQTAQVGHIDFYYSVKDSDGNSAMKVRQIAVNPLPPVLHRDGESVVVSQLEAGASAKLFIQGDSGHWELIGTIKGDANGEAEFGELSPGTYRAEQLVNTFVSKPSKTLLYENPAYLHGKIVDQNNQPLSGVVFRTTDFTKALSETSDANGEFTFGVESSDMQFDIGFAYDGNNYSVKGISSEDENALVGKANVVGQVSLNGTALDDAHVVMKLFRRAADGSYLPSTLAKLTYNSNGTYRAAKLSPDEQYRIKVFYKANESNLYPLTAFGFDVTEAGVTKIVNQDIRYGSVVDKAGKPLTGVKLTVYPPDRNLQPDLAAGAIELHQTSLLMNNNKNSALNDQDGRFGFMVFDEIEYVIVAQKEGYQDAVKLVDSVNGQLLTAQLIMQPKNATKPNQQSGGQHDDEQGDTQSGRVPTNTVVVPPVKPTTPSDDLLAVSVEQSSGLTEQVDSAEQQVDNSGHVTYQLGDHLSDLTVTKAPQQGTLFTNPLNGQVIYLPTLNASGEDDFALSATDDKNKAVSTAQKVRVSDSSNSATTEQNALQLSLSTAKRSGFAGDKFAVTASYRNNLGRSIDGANLIVELPAGFTAEGDYKVVNNHLIVPVAALKAGQKGEQRIVLTAGSAADMSIVKGLIQENGSDQVNVQALSNVRLKLYQTDKLYQVEPYIKGFPDGNFYKDRPVTRAEVAAMLTRVLVDDIHKNVANNVTFSDIESDAWYTGYVNEATNKGLFKGFADGTFRPNKAISRAELAKVIANYNQVDSSEMGVVEQHFSDIDGHWAQCEINALGRNGISNGYSDKTFKPDQPISRSEAVKMINHMLYRQVVENVDETFKDLGSEDWAFGHIESAYRGYHFKKNSNGVYQINALK